MINLLTPYINYIKYGAIAIITIAISYLLYNINSTYTERDNLKLSNETLEKEKKELIKSKIRQEGDFNTTIKIITDSIQQNKETEQKIKYLTNTIHDTEIIYIPTPSERNESTSHIIAL